MDARRALPLAFALALTTVFLINPKKELPPSSTPQNPVTSPTEPDFQYPPLLATSTAELASAHLKQSLAQGNPVRIKLLETEQRFLFRPRQALGANFAIRLGLESQLETSPQIFEGLPLDSKNTGTLASLAIVGDSLAGVLRQTDGTTTYLRTHPTTGELQAKTESPQEIEATCQADPLSGTYQLYSDDPLPDGEAFWEGAVAAQVAPETAAITGIDPATNRLDKYIDPIARATRYDASLKDALLLLVLDKEATGINTPSNLTSKASLYLATVSNVAAAYENQLGIRLLVQEMIMIPDTDDFIDIATGDDQAITNFRTWMQRNRLNSTYNWSVAMKYGAGLSGTTLGIAFVEAVRNNSAVGVCRTTARWDVLAHEMGHNLGSNHSNGGLMNATTTSSNNRSFFTDVTPGETSAKDIYDYARLRLLGPATLRHPEQIPFANSDNETTALNTPVLLSLLDNDSDQVRNGSINSLALEEVSAVTPQGAGSVEILGNDVRFTPATDFRGTAWFSYSLRGSVGNNGAGWLHKGDVAVRVDSPPNNTVITAAPGASYSFFPSTGTSGLTQPSSALVSRSRDDTSLLVIRVNADASGSETFRSGGRTYTLNYTAPAPRVVNDRYIYDSSQGSLQFNPLLNDEGAGEAWVNPIKPTIGVGTVDHDSSGDELFATTFRLISATNRTPEKGNLTTRTLPFVINGQRTTVLDTILTFVARSGASGTAVIDYTVQDAAGLTATGEVEIVLPFRIDTLLSEGAASRHLIPEDGSIDSSWMLPDFDDASWTTGTTGLGYDTDTDYLASISSTITGFQGVNTSVFVRLPFTATSVTQYTQFALRMKIDDGFVAYLNGEEVARSSNVIGEAPLPWDSEAAQSTNDSQALTFAVFDLSDRTSLLREGDNVLAIHGMNSSLNSSDFLLVPELEGSVTASGLRLVSPTASEITLPTNTRVTLRTQATGAVSGGSTTWAVTSGNATAVTLNTGTSVSDAFIATPGVYTLTASTSTGGQTETTTLTINAVAEPSNNSAAAVSLGPDLKLTRFDALLRAEVTPSDIESVRWEQIDEGEGLLFSDPEALETAVGFPQNGSYRLRVYVVRKGVETSADLLVNVAIPADALAAIAMPASQVGSTTASLSLAALFTEGPINGTVFLDSDDRGTSSENWSRKLPLGNVSSGKFSANITDLLFESDYVYRLQLQRGQTYVWSEPSVFRTTEAPTLVSTLFDATSPARVLVPLDNELGSSWTSLDFDDATWTSGSAGVGYDLDTEFRPFITTDVQTAMFEQSTSVYSRIPFQLQETSTIESLTLRMRYDDAFVAYLNGVEIVRSATAPQNESLTQASAAAILREDDEAVEFEAYDISQHIGLLQRGDNVLAIHGLNFIPENRDLLVSPELMIERSQSYYQIWSQAFELAGSDQGLNADPDGDGFDNLQEYALGGDPNSANPSAIFTPQIGADLTVTYPRRLDRDSRGLTVALEYSPDLITWTTADLGPEDITSETVTETVRVQPNLEAGADLGFWRLRISLE